MSETNDERIWSGASPEQVAKDLESLVDFEEEGLPIDELDALIKLMAEPRFGHEQSPSERAPAEDKSADR